MKENKILWRVIIALIFIIALFLFFAFAKLPFNVKETYMDRESYQTTTLENYIVSAKRCDVVSNCQCIHYNFWGTCDSCKCQREIEVTRWRSVKRYRDVTIYCTILEKSTGKCN